MNSTLIECQLRPVCVCVYVCQSSGMVGMGKRVRGGTFLRREGAIRGHLANPVARNFSLEGTLRKSGDERENEEMSSSHADVSVYELGARHYDNPELRIACQFSRR